jgi:hypothetical protein
MLSRLSTTGFVKHKVMGGVAEEDARRERPLVVWSFKVLLEAEAGLKIDRS